ncbi:MAG: helix-turn-helix domain-containing protein [Chitinophagaceae bacterium]|nr:helix-turn-helix domain-containing protein [Chitinophagaceae bacterium]
MKHISILVPEDGILATIDNPRFIFTMVNEVLVAQGKDPFFEVNFVSFTRNVKLQKNSFTVHVDLLTDEIRKTDLIIMPALFGDIPAALEKNKPFIPWIIEQYRNGAEVASLCTGAFFLAATGLLNGKQCSTHWQSAHAFREMYPEVNLVADRVITDDQGIYSSGGANSHWNLLLYLVEKYVDRPMAIQASKIFSLEIERTSQSVFIMFNGQKGHEDEPVKKAQEFIEVNLSEKLSVEDLAVKFAIGRRHFERRFKKATNNTPIEYIQRVRIEAAKRTFETSVKNVNEVMYEVGYADGKAFRSIFKRFTGLSPMQYRNKYNKLAAAS